MNVTVNWQTEEESKGERAKDLYNQIGRSNVVHGILGIHSNST